MGRLSLMGFFFVIAAGCVLCPGGTASFVPVIQWNTNKADAGRIAEGTKNMEPSSSSIQLLYKSNEFRDMEKGTTPAWVGSDGLMRVPSTLPLWPEFDTATNSRALSQCIDNRPYGIVVIPGISSHSHVAEEHDVEIEKSSEEDGGNSPTCRSRQRNKQRWPAAGLHSAEFFPPVDNVDDYSDFLSPSITYADGSDVFSYDFYDTSNSYPTEFNASDVDLPLGCHLESNPLGYLICNGTSMTTVPADLPRQVPFSIFEMNNTSVEIVANGDFRGLQVVDMNLDSNPQLYIIERGAFDNITNLLTLSIKHNSLQSVDWHVFDGLSTLVVLSLRDNQIDLTRLFKDPPEEEETCVLPNLIHLDLSENPLGSLNRYVFSQLGQSSIEELNLKSCDLSHIDPGRFHNCFFVFLCWFI